MVLSSSGTYNVFTHYPYIVELLLFSEAILFSIALSNKIRDLQKELILVKNKKEKELEEKVAQKTAKLSKSLEEKHLLLKELNHRVKNNMQMILSLIRLQSAELQPSEVKDTFITIEGRIGALGHLHDLLYRQNDISSINVEDYFHLLIDDILNSYSMTQTDINFDFNTKGTILVDHAIYCGLILNELITNSLKYAFSSNQGLITILFEEQEKNYFFQYRDNGIGFEYDKDSESLGMLIISILAQDQLEGDLHIDGTNGMHMTLTWNKEHEDEL